MKKPTSADGISSPSNKNDDQSDDHQAKTPSASVQHTGRKLARTKILTGVLVVVPLLIAGLLATLLLGGDDTTEPTSDSRDQAATQQTEQASELGAAITLVEGLVQISTDGNKDQWTDVTGGESILAGSSVRTLIDSRVVILVDDGSALRLDANSQITLNQSDTAVVEFTLDQGVAYSRVIESDSRQFSITTTTESYIAQGTAYTVKSSSSTDVLEVYHSSVKLKKSGDVVNQGSKYESATNSESAINKDELSQDPFAQWNKERDSQNDKYKDKLGFLADVDDAPTIQPDPPATPDPVSEGNSNPTINLAGQAVDGGIKLNWTLTNTTATDGFKIVRSKTSATPTYGVDTSVYVGSVETRSYTLDLQDGQTYYFRVCLYRATDATCDTYSNDLQLTAPFNPPESVEAGAVTLTSSGDTISWTFTGTAPHGFKVVMDDQVNPVYPQNSIRFVGADITSTTLPSKTPGTYYVRVCKYTASDADGGCTDYSNGVTYTIAE